MARTLEITIPGRPVPKPRQTVSDKWRNPPRACVARYRAWADLARLKAREAGKMPPADRITRITCRAYFQPPKSWSAKRRSAAMGTFHRSMPDASNVIKAAEDSIFDQDKALADIRIQKFWGEPERVELMIEYEPCL